MLAVIVFVHRGRAASCCWLPLCPRKYLGQFWCHRNHIDLLLGWSATYFSSPNRTNSEGAICGREVGRALLCVIFPLLVKCSQSLNARSRRRSCCCKRLRSREKWSPVRRPSPTISSVLEVIILIANRDRPLDVKWTRE